MGSWRFRAAEARGRQKPRRQRTHACSSRETPPGAGDDAHTHSHRVAHQHGWGLCVCSWRVCVRGSHRRGTRRWALPGGAKLRPASMMFLARSSNSASSPDACERACIRACVRACHQVYERPANEEGGIDNQRQSRQADTREIAVERASWAREK